MSNISVLRSTPWKWTATNLEAAQLIADGEMSQADISRKVKVTTETLRNWMRVPEFAKKITDTRKETETLVLARGIASKINRVAAANDRWNRMKLIIAERSADPDMQAVPGGKSGLLVKDIKQVVQTRIEPTKNEAGKVIGTTKHYSKVDVATYAVDTGLLSEMRALEQHVSKETGQWVDHKSVVVPNLGNGAGSQSEIDLTKVPLDKLEAINEIMELAKIDENV